MRHHRPLVTRGRRRKALPPSKDGVSSWAVDMRALVASVSETVVETRGDFPMARAGDVARALLGAVVVWR